MERILQKPVYYVAIASQKNDYRFKIGVVRKKSMDEWIIVPDCHEPIIDKSIFDAVQEKIRKRQHPRQTEEEFSLFAGLIKCGECGKALTIRKTNAKNPKDVYACVTYNRFGKQHCTQHRVDYDTIYHIVLDRIRSLAKAALADSEKVGGKLKSACETEAKAEQEARSHAIIKAQDRIKVLERMVGKLYEDIATRKVRTVIVHEEIDDEKNRNITIEIHFNFKFLPEISGADDPVGTTGKTRTKKAAKSRI